MPSNPYKHTWPARTHCSQSEQLFINFLLTLDPIDVIRHRRGQSGVVCQAKPNGELVHLKEDHSITYDLVDRIRHIGGHFVVVWQPSSLPSSQPSSTTFNLLLIFALGWLGVVYIVSDIYNYFSQNWPKNCCLLHQFHFAAKLLWIDCGKEHFIIGKGGRQE